MSAGASPRRKPGRPPALDEAQTVDPEVAPVRLTKGVVDALEPAARARCVSVTGLARAILDAVARDGLVDAVLDDGTPGGRK